MNREEREALIAEARLAYVEAWEAENARIENWDRDSRGKHTRSRAGIEAAFTVFEKAHTPSDFREAVRAERARQIEKGYDRAHDESRGLNHLLVWALDYAQRGEHVKSAALVTAARELLSAQAEPTDAQVKAAYKAWSEHPRDINTSALEYMRAALRAAYSTGK